MNRFGRILALAFAFSSAGAFARGGIVGNGGDLIYCQGSRFPADGYVSLDYALAIGSGYNKNAFRPATPWAESAQEVARLLERVAPHLSTSFKSFVEVENRQWKNDWQAEFTFVVAEVFGQVQDLPQECWVNPERPDVTGAVSFRTIWRLLDGNQITYHFDSNRLTSLMRNAPLQYSMIMVHEWLWDLTPDIEVNRSLSRDLHLLNPPESLQERLEKLHPMP